jgi:hypothetical protein
MNRSLVSSLGRLAVVPALATVLFAAAATPTLAITPFNGYTCVPNPRSVTVISSPPSTATVTIPAGQQLTITVSNNATFGRIVNNNTNTDVINIPGGVFSGTIVNTTGAPMNVTLEVPFFDDIFDGAFPFNDITITFACSAAPVVPPPPPPIGPQLPPDPVIPQGNTSVIAPIVETPKPNRNKTLMGLQTDAVTNDLCADFYPFDPDFQGGLFVVAEDIDGDGRPDTIVGPDGTPAVPGFPGAFSNAFQGGLRVASGDVDGDGIPDVIVAPGSGSLPSSPPLADFFAFEQGYRNGVRVGVGDVNGDGVADVVTAPNVKCGTEPIFIDGFESGNTGAFSQGVFVGGYAPTPEASFAPLDAIMQYFTYDGQSVRGVVPLERSPTGWGIDVIVDAAIIDRSFAALGQRTLIGTVILNGHKRINARTGVGLGIRAGQSMTTQGASTLSSTSIGADLVLGYILAPRLVGALYLGGEVSANHAVNGAVTGDYHESNLKVGGTLDGTIPLEAFTVTPSVSMLLQYHRRPQFTDSVGIIVPALDTLEVNGSASLGIQKDIVLLESNLKISPFASADLLVDHVSTSPAIVFALPVDPIRLGVTAGVRFLWDTGAAASIQADASRGATTTVLGWSGTVSIPIN